MTIYSMTGFARIDLQKPWGSASWEIRSVNQRFLDTYFRLPEQLRSLESQLRDRCRDALTRGKVEISLRFEPGGDSRAKLKLNEALANELMRCAHWVNDQTTSAMHINPIDLLRWPGVLESGNLDLEAITADLLAAFDEALTALKEARGREGAALAGLLHERLDGIDTQVAFVRERMPAVLAWQRERLTGKLAEFKEQLDPARVEQEIILIAQRIDVAEELDRLTTHLKETRKLLKQGGNIGRRLDFMMQEFNRESNTLASKSINADITMAAVELKVLIEQMREQVQNIE
ncbi:MAG: YicC family protein [Gammaproteobacteria bacterium]|nr:YicC family protein [Gammaproteobacteria bacterium]